jgi:nicotinamide riboside kinase
MQKILITGPESSGKSWLSERLASLTPNASWAPEYARFYLNNLGRPYEARDLAAILQGQCLAEDERASARPSYLFCDTGPEVIYIWSEVRFGDTAPAIARELLRRPYDFTLLCYPDIPWAPDPLREAPDPAVRLALFERYRGLLNRLGRSFRVVEGLDEARLELAMSHLRAMGWPRG